MVRQPRISIILPTYNREALLRRCIASIQAQTFQDWELIVVDDGSRDGTPGFVTTLGDPRVRYLRNERNMGPGASRNRGMAAAHGSWIAFQDSDDLWSPEKLERQVQAADAADSDVGVVYTLTRRIEGDTTYVLPHEGAPGRSGDLSRTLLYWNFIPMHTAMVRREAVDAVGGFDETLPRAQDWDFWIRVAQAYKFAVVEEVLGEAPVQPDSISRDHAIYAECTHRILDRYAGLYDAEPGARAANLQKLGVHQLLFGSVRQGRRELWGALRIRPWAVRAWVLLVVSLFGRWGVRGLQRMYRATKPYYRATEV